MPKASDTLKRVQEDLEQAFQDAMSPDVTQKLADDLASTVKARTRAGFGISSENGNQTTLAPLSNEYKKQRARSKNLSDETTPTKSNLTATGQMLDSMYGEGTQGKISVYIGDEVRRKQLSGRRIAKGKGLTNAEVAKYVEEKGRKFFGVTSGEKRTFTARIKDAILAAYKKRLQTK